MLLFSAALGCGGATTEAKDKLFIWKIGSDSTYVYLFGYVPVSSNQTYPLNGVIEKAFNSADNFVLYTNFHNIDEKAVNQYVLDHGMYPAGDKLSNHVSDELLEKFVEFSQKYDIGESLISVYDDYRPWISYNLMGQLILKNLGYKTELGMDSYFLDKALKVGKNIIELESTVFQLDLMSSIPDETIIKMMEYDVDNPETAQDIKDIIAAWQAGDLMKMENIVFKAKNEHPEMKPFYDKTYDERIINIMSKIEGFLAGDETFFIAVGAGLFVGENGLLNSLAVKGYTVEQLYASD
jgi:uncharacterized protein YbaP (TraB family)